MPEVYDREDEPWDDIPALNILREAMREEAHFALWEVDNVQWPWQAYDENVLGD